MYIPTGLSLQLFGHFRLINYHNILLFLSKVAEFHVGNKLNLNKSPLFQRKFCPL